MVTSGPEQPCAQSQRPDITTHAVLRFVETLDNRASDGPGQLDERARWTSSARLEGLEPPTF
jgi:hypothetical protein